MDQAWLNAASKLKYGDPRGFLKRLREIEPLVATSKLAPEVRALRTNSLKKWRETREAALFCVGISTRIGSPVYLAQDENLDYDFVATWKRDDVQHFAPVQLKEVVPAEINASASIQRTIDRLTEKYVASTGLTVAIYVNRQTIGFDLRSIKVPALRVAALWIFGGISPDGSQWGLWGDLLDEPIATRFEYPA